MDIIRLSHSCFQASYGSFSILMDPFTASGILSDIPEANVITISHEPDDEHLALLNSTTGKLLQGPGEYEVSEVLINGIRTYRDQTKGQELGYNTVYRIQTDGLQICHLGSLGHIPSADHTSSIGDVDILFIPLGDNSLSPTAASETVSLLEPRLIIPMGQSADQEMSELLALFLKELGIAESHAVDHLVTGPTSLPSDPQVFLISTS